jgi:TRAP-type C4-dicarboxylate transport system substrate-binding protein
MLRLVRIQLFPWTPALILAVCLGGAWISSASAVELRLATFFDEKHPIDRFMLRPWAKEIEKRSGGSLTIKFFPDLDPIGQYEFAASGEYDLSTGLPGYTSELFPRTRMGERQAAGFVDQLS